MCRFFILVTLFFSLATRQVVAQILPKEKATLNYLIVGFSFQKVTGASKYVIEVADGNYNTEALFEQHIFSKKATTENESILELPSFGSQYTWRVVCMTNNKITSRKELHHFSTGIVSAVDTNFARLRIIRNERKYNDCYVFFNENKALYDMDGRAVWYLPLKEGLYDEHTKLRDMKMSPQGTITFLVEGPMDAMPYEVNYNGDILWKGPNNGQVSGDTTEHYHHEFTRLENGHYMAMGKKFIQREQAVPGGGPVQNMMPDPVNLPQQKILAGTLIEYDEKKNVVWWWGSSTYLKTQNARQVQGPVMAPAMDLHDNAFFFDEPAKAIYVSYKNVSKVVKVQYPSGKLTDVYAGSYQPGTATADNVMFCQQHCCRVSKKGYLYLFNNNSCNMGAAPKLVVMQPSASGNGQLKKIFEYECRIEPEDLKKDIQYGFPSGGSVVEMPDNSLFACMGSSYSKVFIVNQDKKEVWSAMPEKWNANEKKWEVSSQYRASIVKNTKEMERLIWNGNPRTVTQ
jgi:hypothetical protein